MTGTITLLGTAAAPPAQDTSIWTVLGNIAAIITIVGLPYLVVSYRKRAPRFSFGFSGSSRTEFKKDDMDWCRLTFEGTIRNQSLDPNSIEKIHLVVWKTRRRRGTRSYGHMPTEIKESGTVERLPLAFTGRQARTLSLVFEIPLTGSHDAELVRSVTPVPAGTPGVPLGMTLAMPTYQYELAFRDVVGNLFDADGLLRNERSINLRWTLENEFRHLKDGHPLPFVRHLSAILVTDAVFFVRRNLRRLGL